MKKAVPEFGTAFFFNPAVTIVDIFRESLI